VAFSPRLHSPSQKGAVPSIRQIGVGLFAATVGQQSVRFVWAERLTLDPAGQAPSLTVHFAASSLPRPFQWQFSPKSEKIVPGGHASAPPATANNSAQARARSFTIGFLVHCAVAVRPWRAQNRSPAKFSVKGSAGAKRR
jgi:hypothetical protein